MLEYKTSYGLRFRIMPAAYLHVLQEKMPFDVITARSHIEICGKIITYAEINEYFGVYEVIDNEYDLCNIMSEII